MVGAALPALGQTLPLETPQPGLVKLLPERIATTKMLTVAVSLGSAPDDFRDTNGEISGWEIDIRRAAAQAMGLQLDLRPTTFDTLIPGLQSKRFDAAVGQMGVSVVREKVVDMIGTLKSNEAFAALNTSDIKVNSLADLCGVTVATTRGSRECLTERKRRLSRLWVPRPRLPARSGGRRHPDRADRLMHRQATV
jgi:polar amino acid transport system substrate-binding protein